MIDNKQSYEKFFSDIKNHDLILSVISDKPENHPATKIPIAVLVYDMETGKNYSISFEHPDLVYKTISEDFIERINYHEGRIWAFDKKSTVLTLPVRNIHDIRLLYFIYDHFSELLHSFSTLEFYKKIHPGFEKMGNVIPITKHVEFFLEMVRSHEPMIKKHKINESYNKINSIIIETLVDLESNGICVNPLLFSKCFSSKTYKKDGKDFVYSQYNIYTSTGRPSNRFGGINYAALNKENGCRKCFVSRWPNGKLLLIDYASFHPRIICNLINYDLSTDIDIYQYLGEMYFNKKCLNKLDLDDSKTLTFRQLYGGVEKKYEHIKYFSRLKGYIEENWEFFMKNGYAETPVFGRKITKNHLQDPNPNKLFNYLLQAAETEIVIPVISKLNNYLRKKKTKPVLYTYDSVLFDFCKEDGKETLKEIISIMKMNEKFPVKIYIGNNYDEMTQISI